MFGKNKNSNTGRDARTAKGTRSTEAGSEVGSSNSGSSNATRRSSSTKSCN